MPLDTEEKLFDLTQSTLFRTRTFSYFIALLTAFGLIQVLMWHWGWHNAALSAREAVIDSLSSVVELHSDSIRSIQSGIYGDSLSRTQIAKKDASFALLLSSFEADSECLAQCKHDCQEMRSKVVTGDVSLPIPGFSTAIVDIPLVQPVLIFGLMLFLALSLRQLERIMLEWQRLLMGTVDKTRARLVGLQFYLFGPIFGRWNAVVFNMFLAFMISGLWLYYLSDKQDLAERYASDPLMQQGMTSEFLNIVDLRRAFIICGIIVIYFVALICRVHIAKIRRILESLY